MFWLVFINVLVVMRRKFWFYIVFIVQVLKRARISSFPWWNVSVDEWSPVLLLGPSACVCVCVCVCFCPALSFPLSLPVSAECVSSHRSSGPRGLSRPQATPGSLMQDLSFPPALWNERLRFICWSNAPLTKETNSQMTAEMHL